MLLSCDCLHTRTPERQLNCQRIIREYLQSLGMLAITIMTLKISVDYLVNSRRSLQNNPSFYHCFSFQRMVNQQRNSNNSYEREKESEREREVVSIRIIHRHHQPQIQIKFPEKNISIYVLYVCTF